MNHAIHLHKMNAVCNAETNIYMAEIEDESSTIINK